MTEKDKINQNQDIAQENTEENIGMWYILIQAMKIK